MAKFAVHTIVHRDGMAVAFAPGDELPDWAEGKVGAHCLVPEDSEPEAEEPDESTDDGPEDSDDKDSTTPDFTAATPRRRRTRK